MLTIYETRAGTLDPQKGPPHMNEAAVWIDLLNPTPEEEATVEQALKLNVPTREEQQEIEASSRLFIEEGAYFMTATLLQPGNGLPTPQPVQVSFIIVGNRLVTVRYAEPKAFGLFTMRACRSDGTLVNGTAVLIGLLEVIIDRLADYIEHVQAEVDTLSHSIFEIKGGTATRQRRFDIILRSVGIQADCSSKARESAHSLGRLLTFLAHAATERKEDKALTSRIKTAARDVNSLSDHVTFIANKVIFLLDATLGMINIEQNNIIKIFSVAAVVLLPPTLVASVYGMNFKNMPELDWMFGYPFALFMMVVFAVGPYFYFKQRGWL